MSNPTPPAPSAFVQTNGPASRAASIANDKAGYFVRRTTTATKTDTQLLNVPQAVVIVPREQFRDQAAQSVTDVVRYVPGVIAHQGEGNRDDVLIRGQRSNADFYVNSMRDDVQYYRDLYNVDRVEILKGSNAMIFGRGGGGGVINRILKDADGTRVSEFSIQGGQFWNRRFTMDVGGVVADGVAARLNGLYEKTETYRQFGNVERYGINPVISFMPSDSTRITLSYEYFHDDRTTDRGIPSQFGRPYNYRQNISTYFGNPFISSTLADANIATATIEHDFDSGLKVKNQSRYADYQRFYQNVFPGGPVNNAGTSFPISAYNNETNRTNLFNQTDFTYQFETGFLKHTLLAGFEFGHQNGLAYRQTGFFADGSTSLTLDPRFPLSAAPVFFRNTTTDANSRYNLDLAAAYVQDQIEIGKYVQILGGVRYDYFGFDSKDRRTFVHQDRVDNLVSPRAALILKPLDNVAIYGSYSVSYLPSSGDQFSTLTPGLAIAKPERFENREVGVKWDVNPRLQLTLAYYDLDRFNQRLADPNNPGYFILSGQTNTKGVEIGASGYVTDWWQIAGGYAYTDAKIVSGTSTSIVKGNTVGLVPYNTVSLWNKFAINDRFSFGVGVVNQGHTFASSDDTVRLPGYTRVDMGVFYKYNESLRAQINVENLFDRRYILMADGNNNIMPGSSRAVRASVILNF